MTSRDGPVLIVDDDLDIRETLADVLEDRGLEVISAANGVEALELLHSVGTLPSVILLDLMMPIMDGYEFMEEYRKDPSFASIPVVIISAGHRIDRRRLGDAARIVPKPMEVPRLLSVLHDLQSGAEYPA